MKILDFGLARATADESHLTQTGAIVGTPAYMAPEQANSPNADARCDLFSLGCVLYRMCTGQQAFKGHDTISTLLAVATQEPTPVQQLNPDVPPALAELVTKLLAKDPAKRPQSAAAVVEAIQAIEAGQEQTTTVAASALKKKSALKKPYKAKARTRTAVGMDRRWWFLGGGAAALLLLVLILVIVNPFGGNENNSVQTPPPEKPPPPAERYALQYTDWDTLVTAPVLLNVDEDFCAEAWVTPSGKKNLGGHIFRLGETSFLEYGNNLGQWIWKAVPRVYASFKQPDFGGRTHVAFVYGGGRGAIYVNGKKVSSYQYKPQEPAVVTTSIVIGAGSIGAIDEARISQTARYTSDFTPEQRFEADKDTLALYHFDEGQGDVLKDSSDNGHHGKIVGAKWVKADGTPIANPPGMPPLAKAPFDAAQAKTHQEAWAKYLGVPIEYTNQQGMRFELIPPGEFLMGATDADLAVYANLKDATPAHPVRLTKPFYIGKYEVRLREFVEIMKREPGNQPRFEKYDENDSVPSFCSWLDCVDFCNKLSDREGLKPAYTITDKTVTLVPGATGYRLPTEAEWEFACRAGTTTLWHYGMTAAEAVKDDKEAQKRHGMYRWSVNKDGLPNPFGLMGLYSNIQEWCWDWHDPDYYRLSADRGVADDPLGPESGTLKVVRGSSRWENAGRNLEVANSAARQTRKPDHAAGFQGFGRLVLPILGKELPAAIAPFDAAQAKAHQEAWAKHLGVPVEVTNSIGMKFRLIPPGEFLMGCSDEQHAELGGTEPEKEKFPGIYAQERPQHEVVITQLFALGVHEVTTGQFRKFVEATGFVTEYEKKSREAAWNRNLGYEPTDDHPVVYVTWNDAVAFCDWLSKKEGVPYRLPTEAEWEYACRAGTQDVWAGSRASLKDRGWYENQSAMPVGQKQANPFGLFDMQGNVGEWCADWFDANYYASSPQRDPAGPPMSQYRIIRGGTFGTPAHHLRPGKRGWILPDQTNRGAGFRVVRGGAS